MACAAEHAHFNFWTVMAASAVVKSQNGEPVDGNAVAMGAAAALMPSLPDLLEPAVHPNHRKFFHSVTVAVAIACGMHRAYKWDAQGKWERLTRALLLVGGAAYLAHLVRDALTAKSLPVV